MDTDMVNLAILVAQQLRNMMKEGEQLYRSGKMRKNVMVVAVNEEFVDIVIATDYASFTNERGRLAGWIEKTIDRACRCFAEDNNVENEQLQGIISYF